MLRLSLGMISPWGVDSLTFDRNLPPGCLVTFYSSYYCISLALRSSPTASCCNCIIEGFLTLDLLLLRFVCIFELSTPFTLELKISSFFRFCPFLSPTFAILPLLICTLVLGFVGLLASLETFSSCDRSWGGIWAGRGFIGESWDMGERLFRWFGGCLVDDLLTRGNPSIGMAALACTLEYRPFAERFMFWPSSECFCGMAR